MDTVKRVIAVSTRSDSLVLDSSAGTGTVAHAVLAANKHDGGNRRFIIVEMKNYADRLTAERVRRVSQGYSFEGKRKTGLLKPDSCLQLSQVLITAFEIERLRHTPRRSEAKPR